MCVKLNDLLDKVEAHKNIIIMFIGFAAAWVIYQDFKEMLKENQKIQQETVMVLSELSNRVQNLESKIK